MSSWKDQNGKVLHIEDYVWLYCTEKLFMSKNNVIDTIGKIVQNPGEVDSKNMICIKVNTDLVNPLRWKFDYSVIKATNEEVTLWMFEN